VRCFSIEFVFVRSHYLRYDWSQAEQYCIDTFDTHLASIHSTTEHNTVWNLIFVSILFIIILNLTANYTLFFVFRFSIGVFRFFILVFDVMTIVLRVIMCANQVAVKPFDVMFSSRIHFFSE